MRSQLQNTGLMAIGKVMADLLLRILFNMNDECTERTIAPRARACGKKSPLNECVSISTPLLAPSAAGDTCSCSPASPLVASLPLPLSLLLLFRSPPICAKNW